MTKQMMLPVHCPSHSHVGYGASNDTPCPWCEIERLRTGIRQLAHKAGEELGGFHSLVTFAEELLEPEQPK